MGRVDYLAMKTDPVVAQRLIRDATRLGGIGFGTTVLKWLASCAAIYLLVLDRTNWRTNMLTSLLLPYIFFSLPWGIFNLLRGEVGSWIAFVVVVLRLFFPRHFPVLAKYFYFAVLTFSLVFLGGSSTY
ncbi:PREDICTED: cold-regulated 413 plasma membrane protein 2-like [Fragaria vesca subsp. vesca]